MMEGFPLGKKSPSLRMAVVVFLGEMLWGPHILAAEASLPPARHVFRLTHQPEGFSFGITSSLRSSQVAFLKEPDFGGRRIIRGLVQIGEGQAGSLPFAWDQAQAKLYLDLNRNRDLTDDPAGVLGSADRGSSQRFENVQVEVNRGALRLPYMLDLTLYGASSHTRGGSVLLSDLESARCGVMVRSGWQGEVQLNGKKWSLEVVDNANGMIGPGDQLGLKPVGEATHFDPISAPPTLFLDGYGYRLAFAFAAGPTQPELVATFEETRPVLGLLRIEGKFIKRLILCEIENGTKVVLDSPEEKVSLPIGHYCWETVYLDPASSPSLPKSLNRGKDGISIAAGPSATLKIGGPLNHHVEVKRAGRVLKMDYQLLGVGGESYGEFRGPQPRRVAVYQGRLKIASGAFEYG